MGLPRADGRAPELCGGRRLSGRLSLRDRWGVCGRRALSRGYGLLPGTALHTRTLSAAHHVLTVRALRRAGQSLFAWHVRTDDLCDRR